MTYGKKDGCGHARPSFLWYDNDKDLKVCFLVTHLITTIAAQWMQTALTASTLPNEARH